LPVDRASEFSSVPYQGKGAVQTVFTKGIGLVMATNAAFPLRKAALLGCDENAVFVKTVQVTAV
jgi:hypothetical protein